MRKGDLGMTKADEFDAYYEWLGIPTKDQPPHHYRLLGIELFEETGKVIESAADRQMAHVRTFQSGKHGPASQKLLNELSAARVCLLNADKKQQYDQSLKAELQAFEELPAESLPAPVPEAAPAPPQLPPEPAPRLQPQRIAVLAEVPAKPISPLVKPRKRPRKKGRGLNPRIAGMLAAGALLLLLSVVIVFQSGTAKGEIVIESQEPGIQVIVRRSEDPVESITLTQKKNRTTIRAGKYYVEVVGTRADRLVVENESFTVSRGDTVVVKIYRKPQVAVKPSIGKQGIGKRANATPTAAPSPERAPLATLPSSGDSIDIAPSSPRLDPSEPATVIDSSNPTTSSETPTLPKPGKDGYALEFSGSHSVEIQDSKQVACMNGELTAELWAKWPTDKAAGELLGTFKPSKHGWDVSLFLSKSRRFGIGLRFCGQDVPRGVGAGLQYHAQPSDEWHHLAFTKKSSNEIVVFHDGQPSWKGSWTAGHDDAIHNLRLGTHDAAFSTGFFGQIRAFRLSSACLYTEPFTPPPPAAMSIDDQTEVLLDFSRADGTMIQDLSGKGRHGKIIGAQWVPLDAP